MGKIRVKTIGVEDIDNGNKKKKQKKEDKKLTKVQGMKGGERVQVVGPSAEELANIQPEGEEKEEANGIKIKAKSKGKTRKRSQKYNDSIVAIDKNKSYTIDEAIVLLKKVNYAKFDATVELDINTTDSGISGNLKLPHGTGKEIKVVVADDKILEEVEKGKINFDVLVATPDMMPRLARVAKVLGPRGLMPNPKNGTITKDPEATLKSFKEGNFSYKTENKIPVIHVIVGKVSYEDRKLTENINSVITSVKKDKINKVTLSSTMSPGIKLLV